MQTPRDRQANSQSGAAFNCALWLSRNVARRQQHLTSLHQRQKSRAQAALGIVEIGGGAQRARSAADPRGA
jgi:hypothetical protein